MMRGLLLKDWYTLTKQLRIILIVLVVFALIPGYSMIPFAMVYAAMLPVTALAYDERSKWNELAAMMPYTTRSIVGSKYVVGILCVTALGVFAFAAQTVISALRGTGLSVSPQMDLLLLACISLLLLSINLPVMFRFGVEKGRYVFMIISMGGIIGGMALKERLLMTMESLNNASLPILGALLTTAVFIALSVPVSAAMYQKRKG
ncbi:MAG: ABC-2 transporter permease [Clostridiales bacterium]|jgi:hypothetical protein|nr:ABC-2 transporter permease [Eubacteriales bacterium]MDD4711252.1 ABC-2 transporter permease [Eubacteriales bacterium]NLO15980.1 ABC-2 transporter permease [Clostridiales bacterium]